MEISLDITIVAYCRDYDKACRVLYDDMVAHKASLAGVAVVRNKSKHGPKLQIVQGDLVPPQELPGCNHNEEDYERDDDSGGNGGNEDHDLWLSRAKAAAALYGNAVSDYDDGRDDFDANDALEEAIRGCTCIISCMGSVRPTNLWKDLLERPFWRLLRKDVSDPYYVHYASTRKALAFAKRENSEAAKYGNISNSGSSTKDQLKHPPRASSQVIETIVLRPGDFGGR